MNDGDIFELDVKRYRYDNEKKTYYFLFKLASRLSYIRTERFISHPKGM